MMRWIVVVHGIVGGLTLVAIAAALLTPKQRGAHSWAGRLALGGLVLAILLAIPPIIARTNLLLAGVGWLVLCHAAVAGWAVVARPRRSLRGLERGAVFAGFAGFAALTVLGVILTAGGAALGPAAIGLSIPGYALGVALLRHDGRRSWLALHIHGAAGATIAGVTAFAAVTVPRLVPWLPAWALWLAPSVILTPAFVLAGRRHARRRTSVAPRR